MTVLRDLQKWYLAQCNENWEHQFGVTIGTLDNPGWTVTIDLVDTPLANSEFKVVEDMPDGDDWIKCWVANNKFNGVGGPEKLEEILTTFLTWARKVAER